MQNTFWRIKYWRISHACICIPMQEYYWWIGVFIQKSSIGKVYSSPIFRLKWYETRVKPCASNKIKRCACENIMYGTAQCQLDSHGQATRVVWHFYLHPWVCVQAHTHATSYLLRVISTTDKNTSLSSSILHASHYTLRLKRIIEYSV